MTLVETWMDNHGRAESLSRIAQAVVFLNSNELSTKEAAVCLFLNSRLLWAYNDSSEKQLYAVSISL